MRQNARIRHGASGPACDKCPCCVCTGAECCRAPCAARGRAAVWHGSGSALGSATCRWGAGLPVWQAPFTGDWNSVVPPVEGVLVSCLACPPAKILGLRTQPVRQPVRARVPVYRCLHGWVWILGPPWYRAAARPETKQRPGAGGPQRRRRSFGVRAPKWYAVACPATGNHVIKAAVKGRGAVGTFG